MKAIPKKLRLHFSLGFFGLVIVLFIPLFSQELMMNYWSSIRLYYQTFEFNASVYYIARGLSQLIIGYNAINIIGPLLGFTSFIALGYLYWKQESFNLMNALKSIYWGLFAHFLMATTVHPWYIAVLIVMGLFTRNFTALAWSMLIILSYSAYRSEPYSESMILILIEYAGLVIFLMYPRIMRRLFSSAIR